jgi:hypothetical protein
MLCVASISCTNGVIRSQKASSTSPTNARSDSASSRLRCSRVAVAFESERDTSFAVPINLGNRTLSFPPPTYNNHSSRRKRFEQRRRRDEYYLHKCVVAFDFHSNVANEVETEQLVIGDDGSSASIALLRGSIPLRWTQRPDVSYKPKPRLVGDLAQLRHYLCV